MIMNKRMRIIAIAVAALVAIGGKHSAAQAPISIGGFIPFVGIGMTNESKTLDSLDLGDIPFIADPAFVPGAPLLGNRFFDLALLDTGAATHIITQAAFNGFNIQGAGLRGTNTQNVGGATGVIVTEINDAAGIYAAGVGDRNPQSSTLSFANSDLRGQTSIATLTAPEEWTLPNILGLPMAAQHGISIRNDLPQIFELGGRTVRTPQVEFIDLGTGADEGILRRAPLILNPGIGFIQGPQYVFNLNFDDILTGGGNINVANNPASPSVVQDSNGNGGGMFIEVDMRDGAKSFEDKQLLFDTGADFTVLSQITAKRLGFDAVLDKPDFVLEVEGSGGVQGGIPGFYIDELNIDTIGGEFTLQNVPVAVLDVTNPNDPGNIIDGIIGMHLFNGRNLVIDAEASFGQGGNGPSLYIGDSVTNQRTWDESNGSRNWESGDNWLEGAAPEELSDVRVARSIAPSSFFEVVNLDSDATIYRLTVGEDADNLVRLYVNPNRTLTVYGEVLLDQGGQLEIENGKVDAQFINITGGRLAGEGDVFVGTGSLSGAVRNLSGVVAPGPDNSSTGTLTVDGDYSSLEDATLEISISNVNNVATADLLEMSRFAFLAGALEVDYTERNSMDLTIGQEFTILTAAERIFGEFDTLLLPGDYTWEVNYLANSVVLEVIGVGGLAGDYNGDGRVDAVDYAVIREGLGTLYTSADFQTWKANYGATNAPAGAGGVPEPATVFMMLLATMLLASRRR